MFGCPSVIITKQGENLASHKFDVSENVTVIFVPRFNISELCRASNGPKRKRDNCCPRGAHSTCENYTLIVSHRMVH